LQVLISGICGFTGSALARELLKHSGRIKISGFDNFSRPGSEINRVELRKLGINITHADLRSAADIDRLPGADAVIDAAANPSVLAGIDGTASSRQLVEHNLLGTVNLLEYCQRHGASFTLLSTSRVYSIQALRAFPVVEHNGAFVPDPAATLPQGLNANGINETFSTVPPVSLYGSTKLASERLALEYGEAFGFSVWINRCGLLAGAGQFGRPDQGIVSFWINSWLRRRSLKYLGFDGTGLQTRDCLHPRDLVPVFLKQWMEPKGSTQPRVVNVAGGIGNSFSLLQLSQWCAERFGKRDVGADPNPRQFDVPWIVLDSSLCERIWGWSAQTTLHAIFEEVAVHAEAHKSWLEISER
jgi:CDP-paratose 2-epimerase